MTKSQQIQWGLFSRKHIDYINKALKSTMSVAEGSIRAGKTIDHILILAIYLETCPDKIHLASGSTLPNAKLNIGACNGFGLENIFRGRCRWGKYKDNEALYINTQTGEKIVIFAGGGKADSYKKILGNSYGAWIATEINEHYDSDDSRVSFIKVAMGRQIAAKKPFILWDLNPCNPNHKIYKDYIDKYMTTYGEKYNYQHFTLNDNATMTEEMIANVLIKYEPGSVWYRRDINGERCVAQGLIYQEFADNTDDYLIDDEWLEKHPITFGVIGCDFGGNGSAHAFTFTGFTKGFKEVVIIKDYHKKKRLTPKEFNEDFLNFVRWVQKDYKCYEARMDSAEQMLIAGIESDVMTNRIPIEIKNALKKEIKDRIGFEVSMMAQGRFKVHRQCKDTIEAFSQAVFNPKKLDVDDRLDDGSTNIDNLDSFEYTCERLMKDIMYLG